ncbi:uncharacterized protein LOC122367734 [Amphibalanus amphitrite]|uniref:uncharacterized protein LOC122367734 n=1 Tax=Amphibalanus amphitrite TaxID=1232801 RepID=UPI001C91D938|nr:uncharacterized protein LOC122367734 [Amphibalanus amphitrite]
MERLVCWICLTAAVLATAHAQLQLVGTSVVDQNFFVVGELQPGETFDQFKRRFKQENPSAAVDSGLVRSSNPAAPRVPTAGSSNEPLGLSSGATELLGRIDESFSCEGLPYGYYADSSNDCRVYHVCDPGRSGTQTNQFSFFCNVGTEFDQQLLTCVHESLDRSACSGARQFYESSNSQFFRDVGFNAGASPPVPVQEVSPPTDDGQVVLIGVTGGVPVDALQSGVDAQTAGGRETVEVPLTELENSAGSGALNTDGAGLLDLRIGLPSL